ncbi:Ig-like domain-containing protein [Microbacterium ginsengiterrae]|nr:Ig-like domain-containing protein [Microbacterium ginsengiterrae]
MSAVLAAALTLTLPGVAHAAETSSTSSETTTLTFTDTGGVSWTPPVGVEKISVEMAGGAGASFIREGQGGYGGRAGRLEFDLPVTSGDDLLFVGATAGGISKAHLPGLGYLNGGSGGDRSGGAQRGGGGGGASAVLLNDDLVAVAGGGGGVGGSVQTEPTFSNPFRWRFGGSGGWGTSGTDLAGDDGVYGGHPGKGGSAGTETGKSGTNGSKAANLTSSGGGGGGGGGWPSGNGGQSGKKAFSTSTGGGGAGGASFTSSAVQNPRLTTSADGDGYVKISYENPVKITLTAPTLVAAEVPHNAHVTVFGDNDVTVKPGKVILTVGNTFLGVDDVIDGRVDFRYSLPQGQHTLTAEFTSRDRTQHATTSVDVVIGPSPAASSVTLDELPTRVAGGSTVTVTGTLHASDAAVDKEQQISLNVNGQRMWSRSDADGRFSFSFQAPSHPSAFTIRAQFDGNDAIGPSMSGTMRIETYDDQSVVALNVSPTDAVYGEPVSVNATVSPEDGSGDAASGLVLLSDGDEYIAMAALDGNGNAAFDDLLLPVGTTTLTAVYGGDDVYSGSHSPSTDVTVAAASTETRLAVESPSGRAGEPVDVDVVVAADARSTFEPRGVVEILAGDEVVATAATGEDGDDTPRDGIARFHLELGDLDAGTHSFTARFVASPGFSDSASDEATVSLRAIDTFLEATPTDISISESDTAVIEAHVTVTGASLARQTPQEPHGSVYATIAGELFGTPAVVDEQTGTAELRLSGFDPGVHDVIVTFQPDSSTLAESTARVHVAVAEDGPSDADSDSGANADSEGSSQESLPATGQREGTWVVPAVLALLMSATGLALIMRRRTHA